ncbi:MAG: hypothetical protein JO211_02620 [Acidobacteriaceae bacterium]|nr:hypothetical protein [Acidobacteriaceae bacterium]
MRTHFLRGCILVALLAALAQAHIGSPDIYLNTEAGPYQLFVTIRPPAVIPGIAELEVRAESSGVREMRAVPTPISGPGAQFAPVADKLKASPQDRQFFTGSLWMMAPGSWQVKLAADGAQGEGVVSVPVPSAARTTRQMQLPLKIILCAIGLFIVAGLIAIVGAGAREAKLEPGAEPAPRDKRRGRIAMASAAVLVIGVLWFGNWWWNDEAVSYRERIYKPIKMSAAIDPEGTLTLKMTDPGWLRPKPGSLKRALFVRTIDDLIPDHDHLMHLYIIREPGLDVVYHLHPGLSEPGTFQLKLPDMPAGTYHLYADIVHASGFPETLTARLDLQHAVQGRPLAGDDASASATTWQNTSTSDTFAVPDGYRMEWMRGTSPLRAKQAQMFRFRLIDPQGRAATNMALYMGMLGHAAFVKTDGSVFAHIHPTGSVSMAAFMLAQNRPENNANAASDRNMPGMEMAGMKMPGMNDDSTTAVLPNEVSFPYGFPTPGRYRIFVQMKHGGTIETGVFDATAE